MRKGLVHPAVSYCRIQYHNLKIDLQQKSILILGAGGATKGILPQILKAKPQQVVIANRTVSKATQLADSLNNHAIKITGCGLRAISGSFDKRHFCKHWQQHSSFITPSLQTTWLWL